MSQEASTKRMQSRAAGVDLRQPAEHAGDDANLYARIIAAQSDIVSVAHDPRQVIGMILRRAQELTRSEAAVVELLDGQELVYLAASGTAHAHVGFRLQAGNSLSGLCMRQNKVLRCDDSELDPRVDVEGCRKVGLRSMLVVPLLHDSKIVGVLKVSSSHRYAYSQTDSNTLQMMASLIGSTLGNSMRHARLLEQYGERVQVDAAAAAHKADLRARVQVVINDRRIDTVFQPMVRLADRQIIALEALSRFPDERLRPEQWFVVAAEAGLGLELELEAARSALDHLALVPPTLRMSLNASPELVVSPAFAELLEGFDLARLVVEITEHTTVANYEHLCNCLKALQLRGMLVAIDDAGAGFSSLRHILRLVPDIIKLDISLTRGIDTDPRRQTMVAAILTFAAGTDANVVVEGVETEAELRALTELGVEYAQGYLLGRPEALCRYRLS